MKQYQAFYIQKTPQAFDDTLVTFGLAVVVQDLLSHQGGGAITIADKGAYYALELTNALLRDTIERAVGTVAPVPALATAKTNLPQDMRADVYETVRDKVNNFYEARKRGNDEIAFPNEPWDIYRAINPQALPGYNGLMTNWHKARSDPESLLILLDLYVDLPNNFDTAMSRWKKLDKKRGWKIAADATRLQLYNPDSGKGQNKPKSDGISIGNVDHFWLTEWLKAVGFYEGALTKVLRGSKDRKTLVLAPRLCTFEQHQQVMATFSEIMRVAESAIRFDVLAAIRYTQTLLNHLVERTNQRRERFKRINLKKHLVSGFHTAFYKDMGNAVATMNLSFIALPGWVEVQSVDDVALYQVLLDELEQVVRQFDESHSEDVILLGHLRDFVSGDNLQALFRFTNAFPAYYLGKRERNQYARQLTTYFIERIVMSTEKPLARILVSAGFQSIANAIRQATVTAQYHKKQQERKYEVRYGLGQDLARKARYPQDFIVALSDFLHKYNAENARVMEIRPAPYRASVKTTDIDEIVQLIDDYGSETIANLLIAYGHARIPRDKNLTEETTEQENE
jgi:hypothetical protein